VNKGGGNNTETKAKGLTVLVIMVAMCALVASASASPTPFMIYGYVSYENGGACNNPTVNINNTNTGNSWSTGTEIKTNASYNYFQLMLANGTDVNVSEILIFNVTSPTGNQSNITEHTVTQENITDGGLFNFNITLVLPDLNITDKSEEWVNATHFNVTYTVANIGGGDAGASSTTIYIDGANTLEDPVPALAAGDNYTSTVGPFECPCGETLNVTVCADNGKVVEESNETNNCMINMFGCPPCPCEPAIEVNKTVWNGTAWAWVETIPDAEINNTYRFRCEVHNNGTCCNLTDIKVEDNLSDSLEYANNATVDGVSREPDWFAGNKFGWNFTGPLAPCETVVIEFNATVIDCGNDSNVQNATAWCEDTGKWVSDEDDAWINVPDGTDCGEDYYDPFVTYCCKGDEVWKNRTFHDFYCDGGECVDHPSIVDDQLVKNCSGSDTYEDVNYCVGDDVWQNRTYHNFTCVGGVCVENSSIVDAVVEDC